MGTEIFKSVEGPSTVEIMEPSTEPSTEPVKAQVEGEAKKMRKIGVWVPYDLYEEWVEKCCPRLPGERIRDLIEEDLAKTLRAEIARGPVGQVKRELEEARKKEEEGLYVELPGGRRVKVVP